MKRIAPIALVILASLATCTDERPRLKPNILLIVVDTLRADRLGCYGNERDLTPFIDSLAARGFVFRHAYAASSWTNPSVASLLTSRYQSQHGITSFGSVLGEQEVLLSERLKDAGYRTAAFSANGLLSQRNGFAQGYDEFAAYLPTPLHAPPTRRRTKRAGEINARALRWLDTSQGNGHDPVFLHLHYMEPHTPYEPPRDIVRRIFAGRPAPDLQEINNLAFLAVLLDLDADVLRNIEGMYDAEVASLDTELRRLFAELERRRFLDDAIVVITADHGEEFHERGLMGHGKTLYDEVLRVPLIVVGPGQSRRVGVDRVVSLVDVAPTILDWVGEPVPARFEGLSLRDEMRAACGGWLMRLRAWWQRLTAGPRAVFGELLKDEEGNERRRSPHLRAVVSGAHKLIAGIDGSREFFDLANDPRETEADSLSERERSALERDLDEFRQAKTGTVTGRFPPPTPDAKTREHMRALGYD